MKKKTVTITNAMREEIAMTLTARAVKKAAAKIAAQLDVINTAFWEAHQAKVRKLSGLTDAKIKQLIGEGMIAATTTCQPKMAEGAEKGRYFCTVWTRVHGKDPTFESQILRKVSGVENFLFRENYYSRKILTFRSGESVPRLNGMEEIIDAKMLARIIKVEADLAAMLAAAEQFHKDVWVILQSCRTSKQLEDLLPEAAKLVPQPVERDTGLAPVALAKSVEQMLKTGIPEESRAART